jgi:hypothetical protein
MSDLFTRMMVDSRIAFALEVLKVRLARHPSPKKSPHRKIAITAFFPFLDITVNFAFPS